MENLLNSNNLIEIDEALTKFKEHHKREAAKDIHLQTMLTFQVNVEIRNGDAPTGYYMGYDNAVRDVLEFIGNNFTPKKA